MIKKDYSLPVKDFSKQDSYAKENKPNIMNIKYI